MKSVPDLRLFVQTARAGSLSAAARQLDTTAAAASAALKRLEQAVGAPLFVRSTRSLRLTQEGEAFLAHCEQALQALDDGLEAVAGGRGVVRGTLALSAPSDFARHLLLGWLDEFQARFPELRIRLRATDRRSDLYREPVDVALRYGAPADSSMVALPVAPANRRILCASPAYVARTGPLLHPSELAGRNCLCFMLGDDVHDRWRFTGPGDAECRVEVRGDRVSDDGDIVRRWALAGHGVIHKSALDVVDDLQAGRLVALCPGWRGEPTPLHLVCADRRRLGTAIRELRTLLEARCGERLAVLGICPDPAPRAG